MSTQESSSQDRSSDHMLCKDRSSQGMSSQNRSNQDRTG